MASAIASRKTLAVMVAPETLSTLPFPATAAAGRGVTILPLEAAKKDERVCALTLDEPWASLLIRIWHVPNLRELNPDADALLRFLVNASAATRAGMETL